MAPKPLLFAVDIGGTKTAIMIADGKTHEPLALEKFATDTKATAEETANRLVKHVHQLMERQNLDPKLLVAGGCTVPGQVDHLGNVLGAGRLGWSDEPFRKQLERTFGLPVFVEHDANSAALGERWKGHCRRVNDFVFLALGTGVGAGLFLGGRLHRGFHHAAGEVGNMLLRRRPLVDSPDAPNLDDQVGSAAIKERAGASKETSAREVLEDPETFYVAERIADTVAAAVINIASVVDPELVVFGGGTATDALIARVRTRVKEELTWKPELTRSALGEDAQLYGAMFGALGVAAARKKAA